jgi:hypothetical protein
MTEAEIQAILAPIKDPTQRAIMEGILRNSLGGTDKASKTTSKEYVKLTPGAARALLQKAADEAEFTGKFSTADINAFIAEFSAAANKQIESVTKQAKETVQSGQSAKDIQSSLSTLITTSYPSYFNPSEFAKSYVWSKVNFKSEKTLGGKSINALQSARQAVKDFNLYSVSDAEVQQAAKDIAMGKKTIESYKAELSRLAQIEFPYLAERFKATPGLTTKDIALPAIKIIADAWEMDPETIGVDNDLVQQFIRPGGADGKAAPLSIPELKRLALNHPNFEKTTKAIELGMSSGTAFARALGGGV